MPTSIRKASVTLTAPGGPAHAEGIVILAAINSAPTVEVILRRGEDTVVRPLAAEVIASMKRVQEARLQPKTTEFDTNIFADDGNGGKLHFRGFAIAPVLERRTGSNSETLNVVGADAFLNGLSLGLYEGRDLKLRPEAYDALFKATPNGGDGDIALLLLQITDVLVDNLGATLKMAKSASLASVIQLKHDANKIPLLAWRRVLQNSSVSHPEWKDAFAQAPLLGQAIASRAKDLLQQRVSGFWGVINGLGAEFQFFYRPSTNGLSGKFERSDVKTNDTVRSIDVGVTGFAATDGSTSMLPLGGVILYGPDVPKLRDEASPSAYTATSVVGHWPPTIDPGYYYEGAPPAWLSNGGGHLMFAPKAVLTATTPDKSKRNLDPTVYTEQRAALQLHLDGVENGVRKVLQAFAKVTYDDLRLADSTASVEIPLDFTVQVGVRYLFKVDDGSTFTGFVRALRHSLQLQGGNQLASGTSLSLTHIIYN